MSAEGKATITARLLRVHRGDPSALQELVQEHLPWIEARVRHRLTPVARRFGDTQDFVQEALLDVLRDGPRFVVDSPAGFRALLVRIVENTLVDRIRYLQRDQRDYRRARALPNDSVLMLDAPARVTTEPPTHADRNERQAWLRLAVELLEPADREVIQLRDYDGCSFPDCAQRLGTTEEAARKRYLRALPRLADKLELLRQGQWQRTLPPDDPK